MRRPSARCCTVAVGRWRFTGRLAGGKQTSTIASLIGTCKPIEPFAYLRVVLDHLPPHPTSRITEPGPRAWMDSHAMCNINVHAQIYDASLALMRSIAELAAS